MSLQRFDNAELACEFVKDASSLKQVRRDAYTRLLGKMGKSIGTLVQISSNINMPTNIFRAEFFVHIFRVFVKKHCQASRYARHYCRLSFMGDAVIDSKH